MLHVWLLPRPARLPDNLLYSVTTAERMHADGITHERRRIEWLAGRALLRRCLAHTLQCAPTQLQFAHTAAGKPQLQNTAHAPAFNLSHGPRWLACAVATSGALGIDVECENRRNRVDAIAAHYFHADEQLLLQAESDAAKRQRLFYRLWTLKEAFIKAIGGTIAGTHLDRIPFAWDARGEPQAAFGLPQGHWQFRQQHFDGDHHLALAHVVPLCETDNTEAENCQFWQWQPETDAVTAWEKLGE